MSQLPISTINTILNAFGEVMVLRVYINNNNDVLHNLYSEKVNQHNTKLLDMCSRTFQNRFVDSGFDLYTPYTSQFTPEHVNCIDFQIKCYAVLHTSTGQRNTGFYMYPRSSLAKSNLRLANSVGIIDSGYRGNLMGLFDYVGDRLTTYNPVQGFERIVQICSPTLGPIYIELVNSELDLGITERGNNGFGSTGVV
jgi:dUTP pyrophosphatase